MNPNSLPEIAPIVSFDAKMGQKYKHVDFDFQGYADFLLQNGISAKDIQKLEINIGSIRGRLDGAYKRLKIRIDQESVYEYHDPSRGANIILMHETGHLIDDRANGKKDQIAKREIRFALLIGQIALGTSAYSLDLYSHPERFISSLGIGVAATFVALFYKKPSNLDKTELKAYRFEFDNKEQNFIELIPRPRELTAKGRQPANTAQ